MCLNSYNYALQRNYICALYIIIIIHCAIQSLVPILSSIGMCLNSYNYALQWNYICAYCMHRCSSTVMHNYMNSDTFLYCLKWEPDCDKLLLIFCKYELSNAHINFRDIFPYSSTWEPDPE